MCVCVFRIPRIKWCWGVVGRYPCGITSRRVVVQYPCGVILCPAQVTVPCGIDWCYVTAKRPCIKKVLVSGWCYDFSVISELCLAVGARLNGCCNGREYLWHDWCLGIKWTGGDLAPVGPAGGTYSTITKCFEEKPEETGDCTGASGTGSDVPGGTVNPGVVPIQSTGVGMCAKCTWSSGVIAVILWLIWAGLQTTDIGKAPDVTLSSIAMKVLDAGALIMAILFSLTFGAHLLRRARLRRHPEASK